MFNILDLIAAFGGLSSTFMSFGIVVGTYMNSRMHVEALIEENFFLKLNERLENDSSHILQRFKKLTS